MHFHHLLKYHYLPELIASRESASILGRIPNLQHNLLCSTKSTILPKLNKNESWSQQ